MRWRCAENARPTARRLEGWSRSHYGSVPASGFSADALSHRSRSGAVVPCRHARVASNHMMRVSVTPVARARRWGASLCTVGTLLTASRPAAAQRNPCTVRHPMVDALSFKGNHALPSDALASIIATERTGIWRRWFGWNTGPLTCLDEVELALDVTRLRELYEVRGFPGSKVSSTVTRRGERRAQVVFRVQENAPIRIESVRIVGLPTEAADASALVRRLVKEPLDSLLLATD